METALNFSKAEGLDVYEVEEDTVIMHLASREVHKLNPTAAFIWHALDSSNDVQEIAQQLSEEAGIPLTQAQQDVTTFVQALTTQGLLV